MGFAEGIQSAEHTSAVDSFVVASFGSCRSDFDLVVPTEVGYCLAGSQSTAVVTEADRSYCFEKRSEARKEVEVGAVGRIAVEPAPEVLEAVAEGAYFALVAVDFGSLAESHTLASGQLGDWAAAGFALLSVDPVVRRKLGWRLLAVKTQR